MVCLKSIAELGLRQTAVSALLPGMGWIEEKSSFTWEIERHSGSAAFFSLDLGFSQSNVQCVLYYICHFLEVFIIICPRSIQYIGPTIRF